MVLDIPEVYMTHGRSGVHAFSRNKTKSLPPVNGYGQTQLILLRCGVSRPSRNHLVVILHVIKKRITIMSRGYVTFPNVVHAYLCVITDRSGYDQNMLSGS